MNIIDHRILIPQSSALIWKLVSDLSKNPTWRVDHTTVSFLTTNHEGTGVRWRYSTPSGREYVAETVAWYDGLGYEYTYIDGVPYKENKGRIRLQEIPEGTVVQWTFTYQMPGLLGGMRNAVTLKRQVENDMVDSLKILWRTLNQVGDEDNREVKSLMREAPSYEARAQYKPRHPSVKTESKIEPMPLPPGISQPTESPITTEEDTRPGVPVQGEMLTPVTEIDPEFLTRQESEAAIEPTTPPVPIPQVTESIEPVQPALHHVEEPVIYAPPQQMESQVSLVEESSLTSDFVTPPSILPEQPVIVEIASSSPADPLVAEVAHDAKLITEDDLDRVSSITTTEVAMQLQEETSADESAKTLTAEISVFEIFGIQKPSETQEAVIINPDPPEVETRHLPLMIPRPAHVGLRLLLRGRRVKLRHPISKTAI